MVSVLIFVLFLTPTSFSFAQGDEASRKEELRKELLKLQEEIEGYRDEIGQKRSEEKTLTREIAILESNIRKSELELRQTSLAIRQTELAIASNTRKISELDEAIKKSKRVMAQILQSIYEEDSRDMLEIVISSGDLSDFFAYSHFLETLQSSLHRTFNNMKEAMSDMEREQKALEEEREVRSRLKLLQGFQVEDLDNRKEGKRQLLETTRGEKKDFQRILSRKERDIEQIRNQIFLLEGIGVSIPLSRAYDIAKFASDRTGVRPAFLLAVLKQESSWGENVGQCFLLDPKTGSGKGKNTGNIYPRTMKATRDVQPFIQITEELGRNPYNTPVSCPHANYGYGGAMGPAQFLPSTWMGYKESLSNLLGRTPDPWDLNDAFTASALKLANGGAAAGTYDAEWRAAMIYYAGSRWNNPVYSFYGDSVMDIARAIEEEINAIL